MKDSKKDFKNSFESKVTTWIGSRSSLVIHTAVFLGSFLLILLGVKAEAVFLFLTTIVSLEAIYLAIFIQMSVNRNTESLLEVEEDIEDIQEGVGEITEEIEELQEDVEEMQEDVDGITEEIDSIQEDVSEISEDLEEIQEDIQGEIASNDSEEKLRIEKHEITHAQLSELQKTLAALMQEIENLKSNSK